MKIRNPEWSLSRKHGWCPYHDDQNYFRFICCGSCNKVLLECEEGDVFKAEIPIGTSYENGYCIHCKVSTDNAINATSEQIMNLGFTKEDFC